MSHNTNKTFRVCLVSTNEGVKTCIDTIIARRNADAAMKAALRANKGFRCTAVYDW